MKWQSNKNSISYNSGVAEYNIDFVFKKNPTFMDFYDFKVTYKVNNVEQIIPVNMYDTLGLAIDACERHEENGKW